MNKALAVLARCKRLGIVFALRDGELYYKPGRRVPDDLRAEIKRREQAIFTVLDMSAHKAEGSTLQHDWTVDPTGTPLKPAQANSTPGADQCDPAIDESILWPDGRPGWLDWVMSPAFDDETRGIIEEPITGRPGWTRRAWIERLRTLADRCEPFRPDLAKLHRTEADRLETEARPELPRLPSEKDPQSSA